MVKCFVRKCANYSDMNKSRDPGKKLGFFKIPSVIRNTCDVVLKRSERRRAAWLSKIVNIELPASDMNIRICGEHFVSGAPSHLCLEENIDWVPTLNLGFSDDEEAGDDITDMICEVDPSQLTPSMDFISPVSASARKPPNHISPLPSTSNTFSTPVSKPNTSLRRSAGSGLSILKPRNDLPPSPTVYSQVSPSSDTSVSSLNNSSGMLPPAQVRRSSTPNVNCHKRLQPKCLVSESDQRSDFDRSDVSTEHENSASGQGFDFSVLDASEDAMAEKICLDRSEYESLKAKLDELEVLKKQIREYRDSMTNLEVDILELQGKLKSSEEANSHLTNIIKNMEEDLKEKDEERLAEMDKN